SDAGRKDQRRSDLAAASAPMDKTDVAAEPSAVLLVATPPVDQSSANLIPRRVPTVAYKLLRPNTTKTVSAPTVGAVRLAEQRPERASNDNLILLAAAAAAALLFAGGTFHFTRQNGRKACTYKDPVRHAIRAVVTRSAIG